MSVDWLFFDLSLSTYLHLLRDTQGDRLLTRMDKDVTDNRCNSRTTAAFGSKACESLINVVS
jgi:hypothetical protein